MSTIYKPYTYWLFHKPSKRFYYGSRTAKNCNPSDLFEIYFSSSKIVKDLIEKDGMESFRFRVDKVFDSPGEALDYEYKILEKFEAGNNKRFLNKHHSRTLEWTDKLREKASRTHKQKVKDGIHPTAFKKGHEPTLGFTGRKHTAETKKLYSEQRSGSKNVSCRPEVKEKRRQQFLKKNPAKDPTVQEKLKLSAQLRRQNRVSCIMCGKEMSEPGLPSHYRSKHSTSDLFQKKD